MSDADADADAAERWLEQLELDDPTVRSYDLMALSGAARQFVDAAAAALAEGVPARIIRLSTELLDDELSVLLRSGETIPAEQLRDDLNLNGGD